MGVQTDYLGQIEVEPALNLTEMAYLSAFSRSRRCACSRKPYAVASSNSHHVGPEKSTDRCNKVASGQPSLWCNWVPCLTGCCLGWNGHEKFYAGRAWMQYLIDHFLRPGAVASRSSDRQFRGFTFDHQLDGVIAGRQQDVRELFLLRVENNEVWREILRPGDDCPWDLPWDAVSSCDHADVTSEPGEEGWGTLSALPSSPRSRPPKPSPQLHR